MNGLTDSILWFPLALFAALAFAGHNGLGKTALEKLTPAQLALGSHIVWAVVMTIIATASSIQCSCLPLRSSEGFLPALLITSFLNALAFTLLFYGIRSSPLSLSVPYLSLTPVFILLTGRLLIGESIGPIGGTAVLSVAAGSWIVQSRTGDTFIEPFRRIISDRGSRNLLAVALIFSVSAVVDKIALNRSNLLTFLLAASWIRTVLLLPLFIAESRKVRSRLFTVVGTSVPVGVLFALEGLSHMSAIALGPVAYVVAIKRTSILFSAMLGFYAFGEKRSVRIVTGIILMVGGAVGLSLTGGG